MLVLLPRVTRARAVLPRVTRVRAVLPRVTRVRAVLPRIMCVGALGGDIFRTLCGICACGLIYRDHTNRGATSPWWVYVKVSGPLCVCGCSGTVEPGATAVTVQCE